jgi:hypothetical protein
VEKVRQSIGDDNDRRIAEMSVEEREEEVNELKARFGSGLEGLMRKRREKRIQQEKLRGTSDGSTVAESGDFAHSSQREKRSAVIAGHDGRKEMGEVRERLEATNLEPVRERPVEKRDTVQVSARKPTSKSPGYMNTIDDQANPPLKLMRTRTI